MKAKYFILILLVNCSTSFSQTKVYNGAWFEIKYPSSFIVKESIKSVSGDGYESAFFISPDKSVEFYIFSPQWRGDAKDITLKSTEKLVSEKMQKSGDTEIKWWTISAKDGSYTRSYQEKKIEIQNVNWVIGIKYKNAASLEKHKTQYTAFKNSLQQYAD